MAIIPRRDQIRYASGFAAVATVVHLLVVEGQTITDNDSGTHPGVKSIAGTVTINTAAGSEPTAGAVNSSTGAETTAATGTFPDGLGVVTVFNPTTEEYSRGFMVLDDRAGVGHAVINSSTLGFRHKLYSTFQTTVENEGAGADVLAWVPDGVVRQVRA